MNLRSVLSVAIVLTVSVSALAVPYSLDGTLVEVDYWSGSGPNETIVVIDWNQTNGPYDTEAHAWGYRWSGVGYLSDAVSAICAAGDLNVTTTGGGALISDAFYHNALIDNDQHTSAGYSGYWYLGSTANGGLTWDMNMGGMTTEVLGHGLIEGLNMDSGDWTSDTLTIPVPEPSSLALFGLAGLFVVRRR